MNDYYDVRLKESRLEELYKNKEFNFIKGNLADKDVSIQSLNNINLQ